MKRCIIIFFSLMLLNGCEEKNTNTPISIEYGEKEYSIYLPYKENVSSYTLCNDLIRNELSNVDKLLMNLSKDYFKTDIYYYQTGQLLTTNRLKKLLSRDKLNNKTTKIDDKEIKHDFITYIYEQDYLDNNGN